MKYWSPVSRRAVRTMKFDRVAAPDPAAAVLVADAVAGSVRGGGFRNRAVMVYVEPPAPRGRLGQGRRVQEQVDHVVRRTAGSLGRLADDEVSRVLGQRDAAVD